MVFFNKSELNDIEEIFVGLLEWKTKDNRQPIMAFDAVWDYRRYFIYDKTERVIFINKIISNYLTLY